MAMREPAMALRQRAEALARENAWAAACALLESEPAAVTGTAELGTLFGKALLRTGRAREAYETLRPVCERLRAQGPRSVWRDAANLLGAAAFELGLLAEAEEAFGRAAELGRADGDVALVARATGNLGAIANVRGSPQSALLLYQLAIPAYQRLGDAHGLAASYHNMAISYRDLGQLRRADELEQRAIEFAREAGSAEFVALARLGRAEISHRRGDFELAEAGARQARALFLEIPDPFGEADALRLSGAACTKLGRLGAARADLELALAIAEAHESALTAAETQRAVAELLLAEGDTEAARTRAIDAEMAFRALGAAEQAAEASAFADRLPGR